MSDNLVTSAWGPGVIGLVISGLLYGVSLAQSAYYVWFFPNDPALIKSLIFFVFFIDMFHFIGSTQFYWALLVLCHRSYTTTCTVDLPWGAYVAVSANYIITFSVQCFYCHRIWIITGYRRGITLVTFFVAALQLGLGTYASVETAKHRTIKFLYTTPLVPTAAFISTLCDIIITTTIFRHLWRSELRRTNFIRDLVVVFINMGAMTCLISVTVGVVYLFQSDHYWVGAPAIVLSRCYANSLLAVLNARERIRERESRRFRYTIEIPTLPTLYGD